MQGPVTDGSCPPRRHPRSFHAAAVAVCAVIALTSCGLLGSPSPSPRTPARSGAPSPTSGAGGTPAETADFVATTTPGATVFAAPTLPSDDLGPFSCTLPVSAGGSAQLAHIADVRVGAHTGFDRVVFEFTGGVPEYEVEDASPPFHEDPTGREITVEGGAHLQVTLRGGTKQGDDGTATYTGPTTFRPRFPQLVQLEEAGDFEAQATWIIGLEEEGCVRVLTLSGPDRLVIDLEHP